MNVIFRTDASLLIGTGHVMRCLTLADQLRDAGADVTFVCRTHAGHQCDLIAARGHAVRRLPVATVPATGMPAAGAAGRDDHAAWLGVPWQQDAAETAAALPARTDWLVVDHYALDQRWEQAMRPAVARIMVVDDLADRAHDCDLLLDQNLSTDMATRYDARLPAGTERLLGPHHALLRPEFAAARAAARVRDGRVRRLFVFLGGADPANHTGRVLAAIASLRRPDLAVDVVIGGANPHHAALERQCAALPGSTLHRQVDNIAALMAAADLAIGAGGGAMWERCCVGVPSLVLAVADNQQGGSVALARHGGALYLGPLDSAMAALPAALQVALAAPQLLAHMGDTAAALVDGRGVERVARRMRQRMQGGQLSLRRAGPGDCDAIWQWRNAPQVRRFSTDSATIPLEQHRRWYQETLANPLRQLLVGEIGGRAAGILRYDRGETRATISVYLTPEFMGQGIGPALIAAGSDWVRGHWPDVATIEAVILPGNRASAQAFRAAGYAEQQAVFAQFLH